MWQNRGQTWGKGDRPSQFRLTVRVSSDCSLAEFACFTPLDSSVFLGLEIGSYIFTVLSADCILSNHSVLCQSAGMLFLLCMSLLLSCITADYSYYKRAKYMFSKPPIPYYDPSYTGAYVPSFAALSRPFAITRSRLSGRYVCCQSSPDIRLNWLFLSASSFPCPAAPTIPAETNIWHNRVHHQGEWAWDLLAGLSADRSVGRSELHHLHGPAVVGFAIFSCAS